VFHCHGAGWIYGYENLQVNNENTYLRNNYVNVYEQPFGCILRSENYSGKYFFSILKCSSLIPLLSIIKLLLIINNLINDTINN
jgi:hypothetical protein